jgi:hypothetical protein
MSNPPCQVTEVQVTVHRFAPVAEGPTAIVLVGVDSDGPFAALLAADRWYTSIPLTPGAAVELASMAHQLAAMEDAPMPNPAVYVVTLYRYAAAYADPAGRRPGRWLLSRFEPQNRTEVELPPGSTAAQAVEVVLADRVLAAGAGRAFVERAGVAGVMLPLERCAVEVMVMPAVARPGDGQSWAAKSYVATFGVDGPIKLEVDAGDSDAAWESALDSLRRGVSA